MCPKKIHKFETICRYQIKLFSDSEVRKVAKVPSDAPVYKDVARMTYVMQDDPLWRKLLIGSIEITTGQRKLNKLYQQYQNQKTIDANIWGDAIERLKLNLMCNQNPALAIPKQGPLILVSNHPFGVLDGLALCYLTSLARSDFKFLAHSTFKKIPEIAPFVLPIDFDGASSALRSNIQTKHSAVKHVRSGGAIVIFPAGRVSTRKRPLTEATDADWKLFCGSLIQKSEASVLPVFFAGENSALFHLASIVGEVMRESLLMFEIVRRMNSDVHASLGELIDYRDLRNIADKNQLLTYLRDQVYALKTTTESYVSVGTLATATR